MKITDTALRKLEKGNKRAKEQHRGHYGHKVSGASAKFLAHVAARRAAGETLSGDKKKAKAERRKMANNLRKAARG